MTTAVRDKVISYLAAGVSQTVAAEAAGVSDGYVSQLLAVPEVQQELALLKAHRLDGELTLDTEIEKAEKLALEVTIKKLPFVKAGEAAKIFTAMNSARKKALDGGSDKASGQQVTLVLPKAAKVMVTINPDNQIIEVDGRSMAPLPSKGLQVLHKSMQFENKLMELGATPGIPLAASKPIPPHVTEVREKMRTADTSRASAVLADLTTTLNGVEIVI